MTERVSCPLLLAAATVAAVVAALLLHEGHPGTERHNGAGNENQGPSRAFGGGREDSGEALVRTEHHYLQLSADYADTPYPKSDWGWNFVDLRLPGAILPLVVGGLAPPEECRSAADSGGFCTVLFPVLGKWDLVLHWSDRGKGGMLKITEYGLPDGADAPVTIGAAPGGFAVKWDQRPRE